MAGTRITWVSGVTALDAAPLNNLESRAANIVNKTADQTVNNSVVLVNDTHLLLPVGANEVWLIQVWLKVISATVNPDIDYAFAVPAGGAIGAAALGMDYNGPSTFEDITVEVRIPVTAVETALYFKALYVGAAAAGNLQLQWAQGVAVAEDTKILENSSLICHQLA